MATYYKETISLTYPKEMELHPDPDDENHFGIRPVENVDVQPAKFRQVSTARIEMCSSKDVAQGLTLISNKKKI